MKNSAPTIHVIDDDTSFLSAVSRFLRASGLKVETFSSGKDFLVRMDANAPGCVLADLQMPDMNGLQLQKELLNRHHSMPIVFLTGNGDIPSTVQAMQDGAVDFLEKLAPREKLLAAVKKALARDSEQRESRYRQKELQARFNLLTQRELEVLSEVVQGKQNKQIGDRLGICERTVKVHRLAITTKLGVPSAAELTRMTLAAGLFKE